MLAIKDNKQVQIEEKDKSYYLTLGYDIAEVEDGELKIIENSPSKSVAYAEHKKALDKIAEFQAKLEEIEKENEALKNPKGKGKGGEAGE
jgi:septation ring formation regulator EzrA